MLLNTKYATKTCTKMFTGAQFVISQYWEKNENVINNRNGYRGTE